MSELDRLLDDAERHRWPANGDDDAWLLLATWAFQTESLQIDEAENLAWERQMRELLRRELPYREFVEERMRLLGERLWARKLAQSNLRYKYGFREISSSRRLELVRRDVRRFFKSWSADDEG